MLLRKRRQVLKQLSVVAKMRNVLALVSAGLFLAIGSDALTAPAVVVVLRLINKLYNT